MTRTKRFILVLLAALVVLFSSSAQAEEVFREHSSETIRVTIEKTRENGCRILVAKIWLQEPERQIRKATADWRVKLRYPSRMPDTDDAVILINASGFLSPDFPSTIEAYGRPRENHYTSLGSLVRTGGEVFRDIPIPFTGIALGENGLEMYHEVPNADVIGDNTWAFLDNCCIVKDGELAIGEPKTPHEKKVQTFSAARTVIAKIDANNYVIICVEGNEDKKGFTFKRMGEFVMEFQPEWAFNLDGGSSIAMVFQGEVVLGDNRKVFDVMYFTE